jgi:hypothetical protein
MANDSTADHLVPLLLAFLAPKFPLPMLLLYAFTRIRQDDAGAPALDTSTPIAWNHHHKAEQAHHQQQADQAGRKVVMNEKAERTPEPWPQAAPSNLPAFPAGWEYAEPPSAAIQTRAWQLLQHLWQHGAGTTAVEQTEGQWITYRSEVVANGKRGVVAYRIRKGARPQATAQNAPPRPTQAAPAAPPPPGVLTSSPAPHEALPPVAAVPSTPTSPARPVLRQGSGMGALVADAPWVMALQIALGIVPADGKFGAHTRDGVMKYQATHGLVPDGVVGAKTWAALDTSGADVQALHSHPPQQQPHA